jgi:hypothetical protein
MTDAGIVGYDRIDRCMTVSHLDFRVLFFMGGVSFGMNWSLLGNQLFSKTQPFSTLTQTQLSAVTRRTTVLTVA